MTDLASLILGVPNYVEGFVKLGRVVRKLQSLEKDHIEAIEDVMFCAETLKYYAGFLDVQSPDVIHHPSRPLLEEALVHAFDALDTARRTFNEWKLHIEPDDTPQKKVRFEKIRVFLAQKMAGSASDKPEPIPDRPYSGSKLLAKAAYLAFGVVEIRDAMARLNKWITRFAQLLLTSPSLRLQTSRPAVVDGPENMAENVAFVARARDRVAKEREVPVIDIDHLSSAFDIDSEHHSGILRLEDGDFAGYIVDARDPFLVSSRKAFEAELATTLRICRLAAELPSDREIGARASVGILPCAGYALRVSPPTHYLLFRLPPGRGAPCTLRSLLLSGPAHHSLNSRLEFCIKLVTSILIIHSLGLVHKNIRPDAVIVANDLRSDSSEDMLGTPYLVSFGQARLAAGPSSHHPYNGEIYARTLYVHPRHLDSRRKTKWQMRDDIYSLGICLFEVAIWRTLLIWNAEEGGLVGDFDFLPLSDEDYDKILKRRGKSIHEDRIWMRRSDIIKYATKLIPATMGESVRDIVVSCLNFGDNRVLSDEEVDNEAQEEDMDNDKTRLQSVMFVEEILTKLRNLVFAF